jgi:hypothetical protein
LKRLTREAVDREIAGLDSLDIATLQKRWQELYKLPPPFKIRSGFLRRAIAYRLQELLLGGLKLQTKRELRRIAERARVNRAHSGGKPLTVDVAIPPSESMLPRRKILSAGTRLLRERHHRGCGRSGRRFRLARQDLSDAQCRRSRDHRHEMVGTKILRVGDDEEAEAGWGYGAQHRADASLRGRIAMSDQKTFRCAVYTRKSSEEGLEQDFNSLEAQREACEAYVRSQSHEGWKLIPDRFDDGGFSGGNMERPALGKLMAMIREGEVDIIVIYKIDRPPAP